MRNLIYSMNVFLDGFVEGPNGDLKWHVIDEAYQRFVNPLELFCEKTKPNAKLSFREV